MLKSISKRSLFLIVCDTAAVVGAYYAAWFIWTGGAWEPYRTPPLVIFLPLFLTTFYIFDLYYPFKRFRGSRLIVEVFMALALGSFVYGLACFLARAPLLPRFFFACFIGQVFCYALLIRGLYDLIFRSRFLDKRTAILGTGDMARKIRELIESTPHAGMDILGHIAEEKKDEGSRGKNAKKVLGHTGQLLSVLDWHHIELLILAFDEDSKASEFEAMRSLAGRNVQIVSAVHLFERLKGFIPYEVIDPRFMLSLVSEVRARHYLHMKRLMDIVLSAALLVLTAPVSLLAAALLSFEGVDKILFVQKRVGTGGKMFPMYKFRSMSEPKGKKRRPRITPVGRFLRKFRLDELPQFLNVLKGDMSLIGPRPETEYFVKYCRRKIPYYSMVFAVRPGISGWAQVNFGHVSDFKDYPKKFCYNVYYLKNLSLELDLQIFLKTLRIVLLGGGK